MKLKEFIDVKRKEVENLKKTMPLSQLKEKLKTVKETRDFLGAFNKKDFIILAEIKKASPSEGIISKETNIEKIAKEYEKGGVNIISVLTDKSFFHGSIIYLQKVKDVVSLPILRKDFIIDEYQIYESRVYGADAILLIVGTLSKQELEKFIDLSHKLGMECLVEIHNEKELKKISKILEKIKVIGVNNRDLNTLKTDLSVIENLIDKIPKNKIIVSESGIKDKDDVRRVKKLGVRGILTGTTLMKSKDKISTIKELLS